MRSLYVLSGASDRQIYGHTNGNTLYLDDRGVCLWFFNFIINILPLITWSFPHLPNDTWVGGYILGFDKKHFWLFSEGPIHL